MFLTSREVRLWTEHSPSIHQYTRSPKGGVYETPKRVSSTITKSNGLNSDGHPPEHQMNCYTHRLLSPCLSLPCTWIVQFSQAIYQLPTFPCSTRSLLMGLCQNPSLGQWRLSREAHQQPDAFNVTDVEYYGVSCTSTLHETILRFDNHLAQSIPNLYNLMGSNPLSSIYR